MCMQVFERRSCLELVRSGGGGRSDGFIVVLVPLQSSLDDFLHTCVTWRGLPTDGYDIRLLYLLRWPWFSCCRPSPLDTSYLPDAPSLYVLFLQAPSGTLGPSVAEVTTESAAQQIRGSNAKDSSRHGGTLQAPEGRGPCALLQKLKERNNKDKLQLYESEKAKEDFSILSNRIQFTFLSVRNAKIHLRLISQYQVSLEATFFHMSHIHEAKRQRELSSWTSRRRCIFFSFDF